MGLFDIMYYRTAHPFKSLRRREVEAKEKIATAIDRRPHVCDDEEYRNCCWPRPCKITGVKAGRPVIDTVAINARFWLHALEHGHVVIEDDNMRRLFVADLMALRNMSSTKGVVNPDTGLPGATAD